MGDYGQSVVCSNVSVDASADLADGVRAWLLDERIIAAEVGDFGMGSIAHRPGVRWQAATRDVPPEMSPMRMAANGVAIRSGLPRVVVYANGADLRPMCPTCAAVIDDAGRGPLWEALNAWTKWTGEAEPPTVQCPACGRGSPIDVWSWGDEMALAVVDVTFWNWPELAPSFVRELIDRLGTSGRFIRGKI